MIYSIIYSCVKKGDWHKTHTIRLKNTKQYLYAVCHQVCGRTPHPSRTAKSPQKIAEDQQSFAGLRLFLCKPF